MTKTAQAAARGKRTAAALSLIIPLLAAGERAHARDFVQGAWTGGAAAGSTTSLLSGTVVYDSDDGDILVLSTGVQARQDLPAQWLQTDESGGPPGFSRAGSLLSSATVVGTDASAAVHMVLGETVTVKSAVLLEPRGDMSVIYHPPSGIIHVLGGNAGDINEFGFPTASSDVFKYSPLAGTLNESANDLLYGRAGMAFDYHPGINKMVQYSGDGHEYQASNLTMVWDPVLETTSFIGVGSKPFGQGFNPGVIYPGNNKMYVFGGRSDFDTDVSTIREYDAPADTVVELPVVLPSSRSALSAAFHPGMNRIYLFGGYSFGTGDLADIIEFDPVSYSTRAMQAALPSPRRKTAAVYFPPTGHILIFGGTSDAGAFDEIVDFDPVLDTATVRPVRLPTPRGGAGAAYAANTGSIYIFGGSSGPVSGRTQILEYAAITSGTYTSSVFDTANLSRLGTIAWSSATPGGTSLGISFRAGNTPAPNASWSNGGAFADATNQGSLAGFGPARYVQYSATFTTVNPSTGPALRDITIPYTQTAPSATLVSAAFDSGFASTRFKRIAWEANLPAGTTALFQLRTASDMGTGFPASWSAWLGPSGTSDFYSSPGGSDTINALHRDGLDDRWLQYRLLLGATDTLATPSLSTVTVSFEFEPSSPTLLALVADSSSQLTVHWRDNSGNEDQFVLSTGAAAGPANLGAAAATLDKPGSGGTQSAAVSGLQPNTTYYARLRARVLPPDDLFSAFSNESSTQTLAEPPSSPQASAVFASSLTLSWSAGNNPAGTPFEVSLSSDGFTAHFSTPVPFAANLTSPATGIAALAPGTTYYLRVRARNGAGIATGFSAVIATATVPSPLAGLSGAALGVSSIAWSWATSGPAARYRVFSASSGAMLGDTASGAFNQVGLATNTAAGLRVEPYTGTASAGLGAATTVFSLAAVPGLPSVDSASVAGVALSWPANTNPAGTRYEIVASTDGFAASLSTPVPLSAGLSAASTSLLGLNAGTTYYFKVRAANGDSVVTGFSAAASTQTLPGVVTGLAGSALGISSISWTWAASAGPAVSSYDVFRASDGLFLAAVSGASYIDTGLPRNAAAGIRVAARNGTGSGVLSAGATVFTHAAPPAGTVVSAVHVSSVSLGWGVNSNPSGTVFEVQRSSDDLSFVAVATVTAASHTVAGLGGPATHYFRVRALNGDGVASAFDLTVSTFVFGTPPLPPGGLVAEAAGGARIRLDWALSPSTQVVRYNLYFDNATGIIDYAAPLSTLTASTSSFLTAPLLPDAAYRFGLRAQDAAGQEEKNSSVVASAVALASLSGVRASIRTPGSGAAVAGDRVTVLAEISLGSPGSVARVLFEYRPATAAAWSALLPATPEHPNPDPSAPYYVHWDVSGLASGHFELRAVAAEAGGSPDSASPTVTLRVDPFDFDTRETAIAGNRVQKERKVFNTAATTIHAAASAGDFLSKVIIPAGALNAATATVTIVNSPAAAPPATAGVRASGIVVELALSNGQTALAGGNTALVSFVYADADSNGIVDGTLLRTDGLAIHAYDAASGRWRREFATTHDASLRTLSGATPHFSFFGAFATAHADLSSARVYPNPFKPNNGDANDGAAFNAGNLNSGIIFDNLPDHATVRIYTLAAELVRELSPGATSGRIQWDAKNDRGQDVASGGYFAVINAPGQNTVVKKLGILR